MEIVESFIATKEPVGSKTISQKPSIDVSSATIRNEMRELEESGYLSKTHHSSGRVPSDKAYRLYVNKILYRDNILVPSDVIMDIEYFLQSNLDESDSLLELSSALLAKKTSYTAVIVSSQNKNAYLKHLQLTLIDRDKLVIVLVDRNDRSVSDVIYYDGLEKDTSINEYLEFIRPLILYKSDEELIEIYSQLKTDQVHYRLTKKILKRCIRFLNSINEEKVYTSGLSHVMNFWQDDKDSIRDLINYLENPYNLSNFGRSSDNLSITIGLENEEDILKDASIISGRYNLPGKQSGNVSIIGPTTMDYKRLIHMILGMSITIEKLEGLLKR